MSSEIEPSVSLLGFRIKKSADFTSLTAFLLALIGAAFGLFEFSKGSDPKLYQIDRVLLFKNNCLGTSPTISAVIPITVYNSADPKFSSLLSRLNLNIRLDRDYLYDSENYVLWGSASGQKIGLVGCPKNDRQLIYFVERQEMMPKEVIKGGSALIRSVMMVPQIPDCPNGGNDCYTVNYLLYDDFRKFVERNTKSDRKIKLSFNIIFDETKSQNVTCSIPMNNEVFRAIDKFSHIDMFCEERSIKL